MNGETTAKTLKKDAYHPELKDKSSFFGSFKQKRKGRVDAAQVQGGNEPTRGRFREEDPNHTKTIRLQVIIFKSCKTQTAFEFWNNPQQRESSVNIHIYLFYKHK
jgi:hypothetical protein